MSKKIRGLWKEILNKYELNPELSSEGSFHFKQKKSDPSLRSQMEAHPVQGADRAEIYLQATLKAPGASASTKRKWKKTLGLA
jgi:hypothetical protein